MNVRAEAARLVQQALRRAGYELHPYDPRPQPGEEDLRRVRLMASEAISLVLDVGANAGQYAQRLRAAGYGGRIVSFEPLAGAYAQLAHASRADRAWEARRMALGDTDGTTHINVAGNSWSSSVLEMGATHLDTAPESAYVGTEQTPIARLDTLWNELVREGERVLLKLDVQGYEMHALRGAEQALRQITLVQAEMALVPLYEGDSSWRTLVDHLEDRGFALAGLEPGFEHPETGRMLQADGLFLRSQAVAERPLPSTAA